MNENSFGRELKSAGAMLLSARGLKALLLALVLSLIPGLQLAVPAVLYGTWAGRRRQTVRLTAKMLLAELMLGAPVMIGYLLMRIVVHQYGMWTFWATCLLLVLMAYTAVRLLVLSPLVQCALASGMKLREAVSVRLLKQILSGCLGRYLLTMLLSAALTIPLWNAYLLPHWVLYAVISLGNALVQYIVSGLYMACFRHAFRMPAPFGREGGSGGGFRAGRRAAAAVLVFAMLSSSFPVYAFHNPAGDAQMVQPNLDGAGGTVERNEFQRRKDAEVSKSYQAAHRYYTDLGLLNNVDNHLVWNPVDNRYEIYSGESPVEDLIRFMQKGALLGGDILLDKHPMTRVLKEGSKAVYHNYKMHDQTVSAEQREVHEMERALALANIVMTGTESALSKIRTFKDGIPFEVMMRKLGPNNVIAKNVLDIYRKHNMIDGMMNLAGKWDHALDAYETLNALDRISLEKAEKETEGKRTSNLLVSIFRMMDNAAYEAGTLSMEAELALKQAYSDALDYGGQLYDDTVNYAGQLYDDAAAYADEIYRQYNLAVEELQAAGVLLEKFGMYLENEAVRRYDEAVTQLGNFAVQKTLEWTPEMIRQYEDAVRVIEETYNAVEKNAGDTADEVLQDIDGAMKVVNQLKDQIRDYYAAQENAGEQQTTAPAGSRDTPAYYKGNYSGTLDEQSYDIGVGSVGIRPSLVTVQLDDRNEALVQTDIEYYGDYSFGDYGAFMEGEGGYGSQNVSSSAPLSCVVPMKIHGGSFKGSASVNVTTSMAVNNYVPEGLGDGTSNLSYSTEYTVTLILVPGTGTDAVIHGEIIAVGEGEGYQNAAPITFTCTKNG